MMWPRGHGRVEPRQREIERRIEEWPPCLTLARGDVAVSPVDPVLVICDVAPWLDVPIRVPARQRGVTFIPGLHYAGLRRQCIFSKTFRIKNTCVDCRAGDADTEPQLFFYCLLPTL